MPTDTPPLNQLKATFSSTTATRTTSRFFRRACTDHISYRIDSQLCDIDADCLSTARCFTNSPSWTRDFTGAQSRPFELFWPRTKLHSNWRKSENSANLTEQSREPATNWTHIWLPVRESNPGHIGGRRALSSLRHTCSQKPYRNKDGEN